MALELLVFKISTWTISIEIGCVFACFFSQLWKPVSLNTFIFLKMEQNKVDQHATFFRNDIVHYETNSIEKIVISAEWYKMFYTRMACWQWILVS